MSVPRKPKTFKLRALHSPQKFGIAGRSCQEVLGKGRELPLPGCCGEPSCCCAEVGLPEALSERPALSSPLCASQVPVPGSRLCLWEDGTELTADGFWSVPDNAELVLLTKGQAWQGYVSDISRFLSVFHRPHVGVIQAARQLLSDEQAPLRQKLLADLLHTVSENIAAETRAEDPPWFEGLESRFRNKCAYLRFSCASRIRTYLREVGPARRGQGDVGLRCGSFLGDSAGMSGSVATVTSRALAAQADPAGASPSPEGSPGTASPVPPLGGQGDAVPPPSWPSPLWGVRCGPASGADDRAGQGLRWRLLTPDQRERLPLRRSPCPLLVQGPFDMADCASRHSINPYGSRESRVLFSTWNLDHMAEAVGAQAGRQVDWEYFYSLLFTCENLKLVHIACHKKTTHRLSCDPRRIYRPQAKPTRRRAARKRP
ncbi:PREDICTED: DNA fragmentation factor subunit beta [Myotis davidii]|uniref:DNA fragmentation factor subunit beta n=1 Tax=Myotis davidii TaxID=225400 RepID=UPI000767C999|nr:PREDICTED: DNA fragmentation factor subunit beta [Myotis davidii]